MKRRTIRPSRKEDLPLMQELFEKAREIMRSEGNMHQWTGGYPSDEVLLRDMERNASFIMEEDGTPIATFAYIEGIDPTYLRIDGGEWIDDERPYATIHRLASAKESHGVARDCFDWAWSRTPNLRADTHRDNNIMQHCLEKSGFRYCGIIYLANGDERLAYQKIQ
ncbi:MAG: GNAT family N-acetyltransferase [Bacteroidales bacterium]|nr:GNAT family N-acetyltransferase [Bacteroidales bacterium]